MNVGELCDTAVVMQFMELSDILENATSKSYEPSKIDVLPMNYLHTTLVRGLEEYSFLLKCYNLQNRGSANKIVQISEDDFHHRVKNILMRGNSKGDWNIYASCVGVAIRSPKNLELFTFDDIPQKNDYDVYNISLFSNNGIDFFPNVYLGKKIDFNGMNVEKVSSEEYGLSDIESKIIQFERDKLNEYRESEKNEFDTAHFLNSFYNGTPANVPFEVEKFDDLIIEQ